MTTTATILSASGEKLAEIDLSKTTANGVDAGPLRAFLERVERLEEEKAALAEDIKLVFAEAKGAGYDVKILRKILARRKDRDAARLEDEMLDLYEAALGDQPKLL